MKVTILGATGNMGRATIKALLPLPFVETLSVLIRSRRKEEAFRKAFARDIDRFDIVLGDTTDEEALSGLSAAAMSSSISRLLSRPAPTMIPKAPSRRTRKARKEWSAS